MLVHNCFVVTLHDGLFKALLLVGLAKLQYAHDREPTVSFQTRTKT